MTRRSQEASTVRQQTLPDELLIRPFRGPRAFFKNASIRIDGRDLVITDEKARARRISFDDGRGPYRANEIENRFVIVDSEQRAVFSTSAHLWDVGDRVALLAGLGTDSTLTAIPPLRDDGIATRDREVWDFIPKVALGPFMVAPFIFRLLADTGILSSTVALWLAAACFPVGVFSAVAMVRELRAYRTHKLGRSSAGSVAVLDERGRASAIDLQKATRLRLRRMPEAELMAFDAGTTAVPMGPDGEELGSELYLGLRTEDLLEISHGFDVVLEVVSFDRVPADKTIDLTPYSKGGHVQVAVRGGELIVTDRKGRVTKVDRSGETRPARIALAYRGYPYLPQLQAKLLILDAVDRVILETPLDWWDSLEKGFRSVFAFARALGVPIELIDGRWRASPRSLAPGGVGYVHRPVLWYTIAILSIPLVPLLAYFAVAAISDFVVELSEGLMATVSLLAFGVWAVLFALLTITKGTFKVWSRRG